jgi:hypothetical protein
VYIRPPPGSEWGYKKSSAGTGIIFGFFEDNDGLSVFDRYGNNPRYYGKLKYRSTAEIWEISYFFVGFFLKPGKI